MPRPLVALLIIASCGPAKDTADTGSETTTSPTTSTAGTTSLEPTTGAPPCDTGHTQTDDCCCFSTVPNDSLNGGEMPVDHCVTSNPCAPFIVECDFQDPACPGHLDDSMTKPVTVDDEQALTCVLTAFRDGTPGFVTWTVNPGFSTTERHYIQADRTVFTYHEEVDEGGSVYSPVTRQPLLAADGFATCLAATELRDRILCLHQVTTGEPLATCT